LKELIRMTRFSFRRPLVTASSIALLGLIAYSGATMADQSANRDTASEPTQVSGILRQQGQPLAGVRVSMRGISDERHVAVTGPDGGFQMSVGSTGDYTLAIKTHHNMSSTDRQVTLNPGANAIDIDLPPTSVELAVKWADAAILPVAVQLTVHGPSSPTFSKRSGFIAPEDLMAVRLVGMGWGEYTVFASTPTGFVSRAPARFVLSREKAKVTANLVLVRRPLALSVEDPEGLPIRGARVSTFGRVLSELEGRFDLSEVAPGSQIQVSHPGYQPTCRVAASTATSQRVRLARAGAASLDVNLSPSPGRPMGLLEGVPGSDCPVDVDSFITQTIPQGQTGSLTFRIRGLSAGAYQYRADAVAEPYGVRVPGGAVHYTVPKRCTVCG